MGFRRMMKLSAKLEADPDKQIILRILVEESPGLNRIGHSATASVTHYWVACTVFCGEPHVHIVMCHLVN